MISDVSIGTINSGGLDSSLISSIATGFYNNKLKTFSVAPQKMDGIILPGDENSLLIHHSNVNHQPTNINPI